MNEARIELPILVYRESERWVAESLLTGTVHVDDEPDAALTRLVQLLDIELKDAFDSGEPFEEAWASLAVDPRPELVHLWHRAKARRLPGEQRTRRPGEAIELPTLRFRPRMANAAGSLG